MTPLHVGPLDIVTHTPLWVWPLLAYVLFMGWQATRDRTVAPWRVFVMPAVAVVLAAANLATGGATPTGLAGFAAGVAIGAAAGLAIARRRPVQLRADGRLALAGDWLPLVLMVCIFALRYARGIAVGIDPQIATEPGFMFGGALASGLFSAMMVARMLGALPADLFRPRQPAMQSGTGPTVDAAPKKKAPEIL